MNLPYIAILIASVLQFIVGAIWYTPLFGRVWGKIHGYDLVSKEEQTVMMCAMPPLLAIQFVTTIVTTTVLALFTTALPTSWNIYGEAAFMWIGFVVPTQVSAVLFGGTDPRWIVSKIAIMAGGSLACLMVAAATLSYFGTGSIQ